MKIFSRLFASHAVKVSDGRAVVIKGKLSRRMAKDISSFCQDIGIQRCELWIDDTGRVTFSSEIPKEHHQKFRNIVSINR